MRLTVLVVLAVLMRSPPAFAQSAPEEPVGPVSYHPFLYTGGDLPAPTGGGDGPNAPRSTVVESTTTLALLTTNVGRKAAEPTMGVDSKGNAYYAAADFDGPGETLRTELLRSTDGGRSFLEVTPQVAMQDVPPNTLDPYVYVDQVTDRVFSIDLAGLSASYLSYSDDQGETWSASAISAPGANDHQTFFTGPPAKRSLLPASPAAYPTMAYYCVNAVIYVTCSRSTDGGVTFQALPGVPFAGCVGCLTGHGVVDSEGRVFLPKGETPGVFGGGPPQLAVSEDGGGSWTTSTVAPQIESGSRHTAVAVDAAGNVYYVWYDDTYQLPWMAISRDHGRTWGDALMVAPPGVHDANLPMVVAGDEGRVAVSFPGSSVDAPGDLTRPWQGWVAVSTDALAENPTFHAAIAGDGTDPLHRGICNDRCLGMVDFIDLQRSPLDGSVWGTFTDTCTPGNGCGQERRADLATDAQGVSVRSISGPSLTAP